MQPWAMIPVKVKGSDNVDMLVWSTEKRKWKNGSTQKVYFMEVFTFKKIKKSIILISGEDLIPKMSLDSHIEENFMEKKRTNTAEEV